MATVYNPTGGTKINRGPSGQGPAGSGQGPEVEYANKNFDTSNWTEADWARNYGNYYNRPDTPKPVEWGGYRGESGGGSGASGGSGQYVVKPGDSYARIAGEVYGDQRMFADLIQANPGMTILQPGQTLNLPQKKDKPYVPNWIMDAAKSGAFGGQPAQAQGPQPGQYGYKPSAIQSPDAQEAAANFYNPGGSQGQYGGEQGLIKGANGVWQFNGASQLTLQQQSELRQQDVGAYNAYKKGGLGAVNDYLTQQATLASVQGGSAFGLPLVDQRTGEAIDLNKPAWEQGTLRGQFGSFMGSTLGKASLVGASIIPETVEGAMAGGVPALPAAAGSATIAGGLMWLSEKFYEWAGSDDPFVSTVGKVGSWAVNDALDTPRRTIEQVLGTVFQVKGAIYEPEKYGTLQEVVGNLGAAWEAAKITYDSAPLNLKTPQDWTSLEDWKNTLGQTSPGEWFNAIMGFESPVFVDYDLPDTTGGLSAVIEARKKIIESGAAVGVLGDDNNPFVYSEKEQERDYLLQSISQRFGAPGQIRELMSGFMLDPLNYVGFIPASWLKPIAEARGATTLLKAIESPNPAAHGFIPALDKALNYQRLLKLPQVYRNTLVHTTIQDAKALNTIQRALVGEDILSVIEGKPYEKKWYEFWKHTPESNTREQLNQWNDYLQTYVFSAADSPEEAARLLDEFAKADGSGVRSQESGGREYTAAEKAALTLQGQAVQKMIRNGGNVWSDVLNAWAKSADDRAPFEEIAKAAGMKVEDVVSDFAKGKGEYILSGVGSGESGVNLPEKFTVEYLTDAAKMFTDKGVPVSKEMAMAAMYAGLLDGAADFNINHFKVKPGNFVERVGAVVKSAQSIVLLGGSPTYLINNALNNTTMLLVHGIAGAKGVGEVMNKFAEFGLAPTRLTDSFAKVEFGARDAERVGGLLNTIAKNFEDVTTAKLSEAKGGTGGVLGKLKGITNTINEVMPFMQLAKKMEAFSSANAMWQGFSQMWARTWHRGVGFDKMPTELENALRAIDPQLVDHIYAAAELGLKPQDISRRIFESAPKPEVERFIGGVFGERAPEVRELLGNLKTAEGKPLLNDLTGRILSREYTPENVRLSFAETVAEAEVSLAKHFEAEAKVTTDYVRQVAGDNEMGVTDAGALLMVFDDNREMLLRTFTEHKKILRELYEARANGAPIDFREIEAMGDRLYKDAYFVKEKAALDSFVEANKKAGVKIDEGFITSKQKEYALTTEFFERKQKMLKEFWDKPPSQRSGAEWERIQAAIERDYSRLMTTTDKLRSRMDDYMAAAYEVKFKGSGDKLKEWRALAREHDRLYVESNVAQFGEARGLKTLKERNESWAKWSTEMVRQRAEWFAEESKLRRGIWENVPGEEAVKRGNAAASGQTAEGGRQWAATQEYSPVERAPIGKGENQPLPIGQESGVRIQEGGAETAPVLVDGIEYKLSEAQAKEWAGIEADYAGRLKAVAPEDLKGRAAIEARREKLQREVVAKPVVEEVKARLAVQDATEAMTLPVEMPPAKVTRAIARDKFVRVWGQDAGEVDAVLELWDRRAAMWSKETGRPADEWYASHVGDVVGGAATSRSPGELGQSPIDDIFNRVQSGERLTFADKIAVSDFIYGHATGEELARLGEIADNERMGRGGTFESGQARRQIEAGILYRELGDGGRLLFQSTESVASELNDALNFTRKGSVSFNSEGQALIRALNSPDVSTMVHETGHIFRRDLGQADLEVAGKWAGLAEGDDWNGMARKFDQGTLSGDDLKRYVEAEEKFARGFEEYLREGRAPTNALELVFEKFKRWLSEIYKGVGHLVEGGLNDEMRGVYGRLLDDYAETSTPDYVVPRSRFPEGVMADALDMGALQEAGWNRGYKGLLNAINADRAKSGLPKFSSLAEVGAEEAMAAVESRVNKWAEQAKVKTERQLTLAVEKPRSELPEVLSNEIATTASRMLEQLSVGEGPQLLKSVVVEGGAEVDRFTRTNSSNPDWFQKFGEEFKTKNLTKAQFEKVLGKIIEDAGKDVGTNVERVKQLILDEMAQPDPLTGQPPNPEALRLLGKEQEAVAAEKAWKAVGSGAAESRSYGASIGDLRDDDVITLDGKDYTVLATDGQTVAYLYDADGHPLQVSAEELAGRDVRIVDRPSEQALFQTRKKTPSLYEPMGLFDQTAKPVQESLFGATEPEAVKGAETLGGETPPVQKQAEQEYLSLFDATPEPVKEVAPKVIEPEPAKASTFRSYGEQGVKHWQVSEDDYVMRRFTKEKESYLRGIEAKKKELAELGPRATKARADIESTLRYWEKWANETSPSDFKIDKYKREYFDLVKKAISTGEDVPEAVIGQRREFATAKTARERYEKGRHTSFGNRSAAVNETMRAERGFKVKRQDGTAIPEHQIAEITKMVDEMENAIGPLRDLMMQTDLTIAHTNGKYPFLKSGVGGLYMPSERTITYGISDLFGKPLKSFAHEMAHWLDAEAGTAIGNEHYVFRGDKRNVISHLSEAGDSPMIETARRTMRDSYEIKRLIAKNLKDIPEAQRAVVEEMKFMLTPYYRESAEIWARLIEQYVSEKLPKGSLAADEDYTTKAAYWRKEDFDKLRPMVEAEIKRRLEILRGGASEEANRVKFSPLQTGYRGGQDYLVAVIGYRQQAPSVYVVRETPGADVWQLASRTYNSETHGWDFQPLESGIEKFEVAKKRATEYLQTNHPQQAVEATPKRPGELNQTLAVGQEFDHPQYGRVKVESFNEFDGTWIVREVESGQPHTVLMKDSPLMAPPGYMAEKGAWPKPGAEAGQEVWYKQARPMLDELQGAMVADAAAPRVKPPSGSPRLQTAQTGGGTMGELPPEMMGMLQDWVKQTQGKMGEAKLMSLKWAEYKRDAALLNYSRRYGYNTALDPIFPYHFFTTESMSKWALLSLQKPALLANYYRMQKFLNTQVIRPGFPTRLAGKVKIPIPWMPDWMGGGMWIDPMKIGLNLDTYSQPWEDYTERQAMLKNKTEGLLRQWQEDGKITSSQYEAAMKGKGDAWEQAQAELLKADPSLRYDAADAMMNFIGPSMPLQWAYQYLRGTPERISPTPLTRTVKTLTGALGIGGPGGVNLEEGLRREMNLPVFDQWNDYRVDRELAAMAADGSLTPQQAKAAMIERSGTAYDAAVKRLTSESTWGMLTLPLTGQAGTFFTTGEEEQRANKFLYSAAWDAYRKGDTQALKRFSQMYPEYSAQLALYDKPEERLQKFLVDQVWQGWNNLPELYKRELTAQLGPEFEDAFLNKETRSYSSIDSDTLAKWARTLGRYVPMNVEGQAMDLAFAPPGVAAKYGDYRALYGQYVTEEVKAQQSEYFNIPKEARVFVAPAEVQQYLTAKESQFPGIGQVQDGYYNLPKGNARRQYLRDNPQLKAYWDWKAANESASVKEYLKSDAPITRSQRSIYLDSNPELAQWWKVKYGWLDANPEVKPYIDGQDTQILSGEGGVGSGATTQALPPTQPLLLQSPEVWRVTYAHVFTGEALPRSVERKLKDEWQAQTNGQVPFEGWLQALVAAEQAMLPPRAMP